MQRLVLASNNAGKLCEFSNLLAHKNFELVTQASLGIASCSEPHISFVENALEKARHAATHSGLAALADDSGICVPTLNGAPGVVSARYAASLGAGSWSSNPSLPTDQQNNLALLAQLHEPLTPAYYYCVLVLVRHAKDPQPIIAQGYWHGAVQMQAQGSGGFGYDPYFYIASENQTVAQMSMLKKNQLSHRAQALRALLDQL